MNQKEVIKQKSPSTKKTKKYTYAYKNTMDYGPKRHHLIRETYEKQIEKFKRLGIGAKTEFGTIVTQRLIDITAKRLEELKKKTFRYNKCAVKAIQDTVDTTIYNSEVPEKEVA